MSDIALTADTRNSLLALQRTAAVRAEATQRLSTGLRVQSATDDPVDYFSASALTDRAAGLLAAKDGIGQGLSAIDTALVGLDAISSLERQARGILKAAAGGTAEQRAAAAEQFNTLHQQMSALAEDASYGGVNLLSSSPGTLSVGINETGGSIDVAGSASTAGSLGLGTAASYNNFATDADLQAAIGDLTALRGSVRGSSATFGGDVAALSIREDFNRNLVNTLESGAQKLVQADLGEEAARVLASNLRDQLGLNGLRIVQQNQIAVANML